jgi:hypothetical protein
MSMYAWGLPARIRIYPNGVGRAGIRDAVPLKVDRTHQMDD